MKKALKIFGILFLVLLVALITIPFLFKDDIKKAINKGIEENINGTVYFDSNSFSVSLIKNFPNLSISLKDFGIIGANKFKGDTLVAMKEFSVAIDVMSIISGKNIEMTNLTLDGLYLNAIVLKDSTANYLDILKESSEEEIEEPSSEEPSSFSFSGKWNIKNGRIKYTDHTSKMFADIQKINHNGKGDFTQDIFDLVTSTNLSGLTFSMEGSKYLNNADFTADITLNMDMKNSKYSFKENILKLNDFTFGFDGWITMNEDESMDMDIKYATKETEFKNILSLVPGFFMEGFEDIKTKGSLAFDGDVKGKYFDTLNIPAFSFNLKVADAMFQYPDLPSKVENIAMDLAVKSEQDKMEEMQINLSKFHLDMGSNPVDAKTEMKFKGSFDKIYLNSDINAKINLGEISSYYPIEGLELKGIFSIISKAMGTLDIENETFPSSDTKMSLTNGYVKSSEFPAPIENLSFDVSIQNENGSLQQTFIALNQFNMLLDGDPFSMQAKINDLDAVNFDVNIEGKIDFEKITKIYPLEDMTLKGLLDAKISTKGSMTDVEKENYGNIPTSGIMTFTNFEYYDTEYVINGFKMKDAMFVFTPSKIMIEKLEGNLGNSDLNVTGELSNYINYTFGENDVLKGKMNFSSNTFDVDEWMVEEETTNGSTPTEEEPLEVIELPTNIDFILSSSIANVKYDNMGIKNLKGDVIMKDGKACFKNAYFELIGGQFILNGCYDPTDMAHPKYDFDMDIKNAQIPEAYKTFNTIQKLAPIAETMTGNFSTKFKFNGELDQEMMPILETMSGKGLINIADAKITGSKFLGKMAQVTGVKSLETTDISTMLIDAEIKNGRLHIAPFNTKFGQDNILEAKGSNGVDGTLDYILNLNMPSGEIGKAAGSALSNLIGTDINTERAKFNVLVGGLMDDPKLKLNKDGVQTSAKDVVNNAIETKKEETKQAVIEKKEEVIKDTKEDLKKQADQILATAQQQANQVKAQAQKSADAVKKEGYDQALKLENSSSNPLQKKANKLAADKIRNETDQKSTNIIKEGNTKADAIMAKANKQVDELYNK